MYVSGSVSPANKGSMRLSKMAVQLPPVFSYETFQTNTIGLHPRNIKLNAPLCRCCKVQLLSLTKTSFIHIRNQIARFTCTSQDVCNAQTYILQQLRFFLRITLPTIPFSGPKSKTVRNDASMSSVSLLEYSKKDPSLSASETCRLVTYLVNPSVKVDVPKQRISTELAMPMRSTDQNSMRRMRCCKTRQCWSG